MCPYPSPCPCLVILMCVCSDLVWLFFMVFEGRGVHIIVRDPGVLNQPLGSSKASRHGQRVTSLQRRRPDLPPRVRPSRVAPGLVDTGVGRLWLHFHFCQSYTTTLILLCVAVPFRAVPSRAMLYLVVPYFALCISKCRLYFFALSLSCVLLCPRSCVLHVASCVLWFVSCAASHVSCLVLFLLSWTALHFLSALDALVSLTELATRLAICALFVLRVVTRLLRGLLLLHSNSGVVG